VSPDLPLADCASKLVRATQSRDAARRPLTFGSGGSGTTAHLGAEVLKQVAGIDMTHIPYRGTSQAMTDVLAGRVDMMFAPIAVARPHILSGTVRGLAITPARRSPLLPQVLTVGEAGLPEAEIEVWIGLFAPATTPAPVITALHDATGRALRMPAIRDGFAQEGSDAVFDLTPAEFAGFVDEEIRRWVTVVRRSGAAVE